MFYIQFTINGACPKHNNRVFYIHYKCSHTKYEPVINIWFHPVCKNQFNLLKTSWCMSKTERMPRSPAILTISSTLEAWMTKCRKAKQIELFWQICQRCLILQPSSLKHGRQGVEMQRDNYIIMKTCSTSFLTISSTKIWMRGRIMMCKV